MHPRHLVPRPTRLSRIALIAVAGIVAACGATAAPSATAPASSTPASAAPSALQVPSHDTTTAPSPSATPLPTLAPASEPPAAPSGVALAVQHGLSDAAGNVLDELTVTWAHPLAPGTQIRVYGVTKCLHKPTKAGVPCVGAGMAVPASARRLLAKAAAADGSVSWRWGSWDATGDAIGWDGTRSYYAFIVAAWNGAGRSHWVVVESGISCSGCMS